MSKLKKKNTPSKPVTLELLAQMVARGFEAVDKRFESVDERFDAIDKRFEIVDDRFDLIDKKFEAIDDRFDSIDSQLVHLDIRIGRVENEVQDINNNIIAINEFDDLSARVKYLEMKMGIESGKD